MEKAYKLLAIQEGISNNEAKELIDAGLVSVGGQRVVLARGLLKESAKFKITKLSKPTKIFEDENITTRNNLKISLLLSLITVVVALIKGV